MQQRLAKDTPNPSPLSSENMARSHFPASLLVKGLDYQSDPTSNTGSAMASVSPGCVTNYPET